MERLFPVGAPGAALLEVVTDYGPVGKGASEARYVRVSNGTEYLIKGPSLVEGQPTVAVNEWVAAGLAELIGLPHLDCRLVTMGEHLFFASLWMGRGTFAPGVDALLFKKCANQDLAYDVAVFDTWLVNTDRNEENLVVRLPRQSGEPHLLILNDHSHLLINPLGARTVEKLLERIAAPVAQPYVSLPFVREHINSRELLGQAITRVESPTDNQIRHLIDSTPDGLCDRSYLDAYAAFLIKRRPLLRGLFEGDHRDVFPNLGT